MFSHSGEVWGLVMFECFDTALEGAMLYLVCDQESALFRVRPEVWSQRKFRIDDWRTQKSRSLTYFDVDDSCFVSDNEKNNTRAFHFNRL